MKTQENKAPQKAQDDVKTVAFFFSSDYSF